MRDKLIFVINNMASRYNKDEFIDKTFRSIYQCTEADYFDTQLIIVDDSGESLTDSQFYEYYKDMSSYYNVKVISNKKNLNLLHSRFVIFDALNKNELNNTWIRYIDSGDIAVDSRRFQMDLMMKMNNCNADLFIFPQGIMNNPNDVNSFYYSCLGDSMNPSRIVESILSCFLACPMWTKVFRADLLYKTMLIIKEINGEIPYLFHMEDYMINCIYSKFINNIASLNTVYILYDIVSGYSRKKSVSKEYFSEVQRQSEIVKNTIKKAFEGYSIDDNILDYYIDKKISHYTSRMVVE